MPTPEFEFFEMICGELVDRDNRVLTAESFPRLLLGEMRRRCREASDELAIAKTLSFLVDHFRRKGSRFPFRYNLRNGVFTTVDHDFIKFVTLVSNIRGQGKDDARDFELEASRRVAKRVTGTVCRVGWPRVGGMRAEVIRQHIESLGFDRAVLPPRAGDGGLDIVWLPLLGEVPLCPIFSLQCKNTSFNLQDGNDSVGRTQQAMGHHQNSGSTGTYVCFVIFNDYVLREHRERVRHASFIPLGLSDLSSARRPLVRAYEM
jgi:hypothetical protein